MNKLFVTQVGHDVLTHIIPFLAVKELVRLSGSFHEAREYLQNTYVDKTVYAYSNYGEVEEISTVENDEESYEECERGNIRTYYMRGNIIAYCYSHLLYTSTFIPIFVQPQPSVSVIELGNCDEEDIPWYEYYALVTNGKISKYIELYVDEHELERCAYFVFVSDRSQDPTEFIFQLIKGQIHGYYQVSKCMISCTEGETPRQYVARRVLELFDEW